MAFKLAEAFVELKAKGHADVVKENEKVKESVKTIGPAADEAGKRIEKASSAMSVSLQNTGRVGTETMNKLRKEMMDTALALEKLAEKEKQLNAGGGGGGGGFGLNQNTKFGTLGKLAGIGGSVAGLVGIARAVTNRGGDLADGAKSEILGNEMGGAVANFSRGLGQLVSDIKTGFVDGLLGLVSYAGDFLTGGILSRWGASMAEEKRRRSEDRAQHNDVRAFVDEERASGRRSSDLDAREEIRSRLNFNGGKESLIAERADLARTNAGGNIERIRMIDDELLALKQRELEAAKKSTSLNEELGDAVAESMEAAKREAAARMRIVAAIDQIGQSELAKDEGISRARQQLNEMIRRAGDKAADPNSPEGRAIAGARERVNKIEANDAKAEFDKENAAAQKRFEDEQERQRVGGRGREFDRTLRDALDQPSTTLSQMGIADLQGALQQSEIAKANEEMRRQNQEIADKANDKRDEIIKGTQDITDAVKKIVAGAILG